MSQLKEGLYEIISTLDYEAFVSLQQKATSSEDTVMCVLEPLYTESSLRWSVVADVVSLPPTAVSVSTPYKRRAVPHHLCVMTNPLVSFAAHIPYK